MNSLSKIITLIATLSILIAIIMFAINPSSLSTEKRYKENVFTSDKTDMTKGKQKLAQTRRHDKTVRIISDSMVSLGDFTFNSGGNTKVIANITLKFKSTKDGWLNSDDGKDEIKKRGTLLRSSVIDTMMDNHGVKSNNDKLKTQLLQNINNNLSEATATEIYFNKFIVQH